MPERPHTPCTVPGCPGRGHAGPCPAHARSRARARGSSTEQGYGRAWDRIRARFLHRHRWCVLCNAPATIADHHPRSRRQLVAAKVLDPDADNFLRPLCDPCHRRVTGHRQPGGWRAQRL